MLVFVQVHGTNDIVKSEVLKIKPTLTPDAPHIAVTVIGLEERRQVEKVTCDLINKRDRSEHYQTEGFSLALVLEVISYMSGRWISSHFCLAESRMPYFQVNETLWECNFGKKTVKMVN